MTIIYKYYFKKYMCFCNKMLCKIIINYLWFYIRLTVFVKGQLVIEFKKISMYDIVTHAFKLTFLEINDQNIKKHVYKLSFGKPSVDYKLLITLRLTLKILYFLYYPIGL